MSEQSLGARIQQAANDLQVLHEVVHGSADATVQTDNGPVPTLATRLLAVESQAVESAGTAADRADEAVQSASEADQIKTDTQNIHDLVVMLTSAANDAMIAAEAAYDAMDDRNLGAKPGPADPATDNDGDPLQVGAWYFNEALEQVRIFKGPFPVDWSNAAPGASGFYTKVEVDLLLAAKAALNHIHTITEITGLQDALDAKSNAEHLHNLPDITGLQDALGAKSDASHAHAFGDLTGRPSTIAGYGIIDAYNQAEIDTLIATITGGAPALLDTLNELAQALGDDPNFAATVTAQIAEKAALSHAHAIADVTSLQAVLDAKLDDSQVGSGANQIVALDGDGKLGPHDASQLINLPSSSPDWVESYITTTFSSSASFPHDNSKPQITEGVEIANISGVVVAAGEKVEIEFSAQIFGNDNAMGLAIFHSGSSSALDAVVLNTYSAGDTAFTVPGKFVDTPGAGTFTYSVRMGRLTGSGSFRVNSSTLAGNQLFNGASHSGLRLKVF